MPILISIRSTERYLDKTKSVPDAFEYKIHRVVHCNAFNEMALGVRAMVPITEEHLKKRRGITNGHWKQLANRA